MGLWTEKRSHTEVTKFEIQGDTSETSMDFLYTEALQGTAQYMGDWELFKDDDRFRYGEGVISKTDGKEVKWNFIGDGFALWAPTGPDFGKGELWLDGQYLTTIDFSSEKQQASRILYTNYNVPYERHGVKLKVTEGRIPVDVLEAYTR
jgi:hypothetical protein